jgi:hypothetical protein
MKGIINLIAAIQEIQAFQQIVMTNIKTIGAEMSTDQNKMEAMRKTGLEEMKISPEMKARVRSN